MSFEEFINFHERKTYQSVGWQVTPGYPDGFVNEKKVTVEEVNALETEFQMHLPANYKRFCTEFGGGYFGYTIIFSLDRTGDWFVFNQQGRFALYGQLNEPQYLAFSDDQTGGIYCFERRGRDVLDQIIYFDELGSIEPVAYNDFLDFVSKTAYN